MKMKNNISRFLELSKLFSKPHPWHGITVGDQAPGLIKVYIEIVPGDTMKYELDKESGYLKIDRPQRFSSICPLPYGFIPQTLCAERVGNYCMEKAQLSGRKIKGDGDPLDICVLTERNIPHGNLILDAIPLGGFRMIDGEEADDKIIAVKKGDALYGDFKSLDEIPDPILERLYHYFVTYKEIPDPNAKRKCEITDVYEKNEAHEVIQRSMEDYQSEFNISKQELFEMINKGLQ